MSTSFPPNFVWGASTSAHQVEGGNVNDWTLWEYAHANQLAAEATAKFSSVVPDWEAIRTQAQNPANYISGQASGHYTHFREDIAIMKALGLKAFRFSVEWSRIEPKQGEINEAELAHYKAVVAELKAAGIEPWVTLWHRTNPVWVAEQGGWENEATVTDYGRYVKRVVEALPDVRFWMPLNEPIMSLSGGHLGGVYPPGKKSVAAAYRVFRNFAAAHNLAYDLIHESVNGAQVGIPHAAVYTESYKNRWYNRLLVRLVDHFANWKFLDAIQQHTDFIGIQYYSRGLLNFSFRPKAARAPFVEEIQEGEWKSDMGWQVYPEGLHRFAMAVWQRYRKPMYITENGITDAHDTSRERFIIEHVKALYRARTEGADVRGYFYWSLLDNLEWDKGFWPRFGLVEVDYKTLKRTVRPSAYAYKKIIEHNGLV